MTPTRDERRVLVIDDNPAIHDDFRKIFAVQRRGGGELADLESQLFDEPSASISSPEFQIDTASQGREGLACVQTALAAGRPYAVAFVDMRMPPGWDGLETIEQLWRVDPELQVVICSAYSDYSWEDLRSRLGDRDGLLIIKKPFDPIEVVQSVHALTTKWQLARVARAHVDGLEAAVKARTAELEASNARLSQEMKEREQIEAELRLAQKLEAIGQLAAGVAHEINTPIQFLGDSLHFVRTSMTDLIGMVGDMGRAVGDSAELRARFDELSEEVDFLYLQQNMPNALQRMHDGIARVTNIVRSMKELAHPGPRDLEPMDVNRALRNALEVTANSYKYIADVATDLAELPPVVAYPSDLGQVFLNLIVNAAQAIEDGARSSDQRGRLTITTRIDGADVVVSVGDSGPGIPDSIRERIFEAFFTTKEVGRGTGQGLAISRKIVDRHAGALTFETALGVGTTFHIRLPIAGPPRAAAA
jgi:two-component system NtrC family sensor kinase